MGAPYEGARRAAVHARGVAAANVEARMTSGTGTNLVGGRVAFESTGHEMRRRPQGGGGRRGHEPGGDSEDARPRRSSLPTWELGPRGSGIVPQHTVSRSPQ